MSDQRNDLDILRRLIGYIRGETRLLLIIPVMLIMSALTQSLGPTLIGRAIDQYITAGDRAGLARTMLQLGAVYVVGYVGFMGQVRFMGMLTQRLLLRLRGDIFTHVQRLGLDYYYKHSAGDLMSRLVREVGVVEVAAEGG